MLLRVQYYLRAGSLVPQKKIALSTAGALPDLRFCLGLGLSRCRCWPIVLLSWQLGRLEAAAELALFERKWRMACNDFLAAVKGLAKPTTVEPHQPAGETGK